MIGEVADDLIIWLLFEMKRLVIFFIEMIDFWISYFRVSLIRFE